VGFSRDDLRELLHHHGEVSFRAKVVAPLLADTLVVAADSAREWRNCKCHVVGIGVAGATKLNHGAGSKGPAVFVNVMLFAVVTDSSAVRLDKLTSPNPPWLLESSQ
jgi:hypothetical protein